MKHAVFAPQFDLSSVVPSPSLVTTFLPALELDLADASTDQAIAHLLSPGRRRAFFMNAHCCNVRRRDTEYRNAVDAADVLLPDGINLDGLPREGGQDETLPEMSRALQL